MADLGAMATGQAAEQEAADAEAEARLLDVWGDAYAVAAAALADLLKRLAQARAAGVTVDRAWVRRVSRLQDVVATTRRALRGYADVASIQTRARQAQAVQAGLDHAVDLVKAAVAEAPDVAASVVAAQRDNLDVLVDRMGDGTPISRHMRATVADDAADALAEYLAKSMVDGVAPNRLAEQFAREMALSHTRAATIMRTEAARVLREASRETYAANPDVVESWTWHAELGRRTCPACAVMHGTRHPVTETLDGHPRCRCAMVPDTVSYASLGIAGVDDPAPIPLGVDWITAMPPAQRRAFLGPAKDDALNAGTITLPDLVARSDDPDWGTMRTERSLKAIREGRNANWGGLGDALGLPA